MTNKSIRKPYRASWEFVKARNGKFYLYLRLNGAGLDFVPCPDELADLLCELIPARVSYE